MKVTISRNELFEKLSGIQSIVDKKSTMPILSHFLLNVDETSNITATDLETAITEPLEILSTDEPGTLCLPARRLYEIVREVDGDIRLESEDSEWVKISSGKSSFRIACMNPEDFPKWPEITEKRALTVGMEKLKEMIDRTLFSAGESDTRYTLNSLLFHIKPEEKTLRVVGTDGHRLSMISTEIEVDFQEEQKLIVPRKSASELRKFLSSHDGDVTIDVTSKHVIFNIGDIRFLVRLIEGNYPAYEQVIPVNNQRKLTINREDFLKALKRVSIISREKSYAVKIDVAEGMLTLTASHPDVGEATDEVSIKYSGEPISLGFNARYLMDALNNMDSEEVFFEIQEPLTPTLLRETNREDYLSVIMPMRI
ncbi:MAG: DNA polymerase III subunit beta [Nitrospirae bacterium]|nr:MAG: DNA polymerase III subunit beta [Nitrospirota bacterium]